MARLLGCRLSACVAVLIIVSLATPVSAEVGAVIPAGNSPYRAVYDSSTNQIYVTNSGDSSVSVISDSANAIVASLTVGRLPWNIVYDSGKGTIWVANAGSNTLSVIDDKTNGVIKTLNTGSFLDPLAYDSGKGEIFLAGPGSINQSSVLIINDTSYSTIGTLNVNGGIAGCAYDSNKNEVFFACRTTSNSSVVVVDDRNDSIVSSVSLANYVQSIVYDPKRGEVFVACTYDSVYVISDSTNQVTATITVGNSPQDITYDSSRGEIFLVNAISISDGTDGQDTIEQGYLVAINENTNSVIGWLPLATTPSCIVYDSSKQELFLVDSLNDTISVISDSVMLSTKPLPTPQPGLTTSFNALGEIIALLFILPVILTVIFLTIRSRKSTNRVTIA